MLETLQNLLNQSITWMTQPQLWWQIAILVLTAFSSIFFQRFLLKITGRYRRDDKENRLQRLTIKSLERILFPIVMLTGVLLGRAILQGLQKTTGLLDIAIPLLVSLAIIRFAVYLLRKAFTPSPLVKAWENVISSTVWIIVALHLIGWLPHLISGLDNIAFNIGQSRFSLLMGIKLLLAIIFFWILALWLARAVERGVSRSPHISSGMQVGLAKFSKFFLLAIAVLVALNAVGVDLSALMVFGGALGVGIGFGLQRIASNFISGFILLFDRSIRPGDVITIGDKFGWVQEFRARYVVVRDRDGVETLIPNENLVTSDVINWSYTDPDVRIKIPVQISYADDPEQAMKLMLECAKDCSRVKTEPEPVCRLMDFADSGIQLELRVWIMDPENGIASVRSEINLSIWRYFKQAGITIPYPQRDIHIKSDGKL